MSNFRMVNLEKDFQQLETRPIIANEFDISTNDGKQRFDNALLTVYEGTALKPAPQCSCTENPLRGRFRLGEVCNVCGDEVSEVFEKDINSDIWLVPLPKVNTFITPLAWHIMGKLMKLDSIDCLRYLTDPYYKIGNKKLPSRLRNVITVFCDKYGRGINMFHENFDDIMALFISNGTNKAPPQALEVLKQFIRYNRDKIFTSYLPVPNRVMFPIEKSGVSNYGDKNMVAIVDAVRIIQEGESRSATLTQMSQESRVVKCIDLFTQYHFKNIKGVIGSKYGMGRQHLFGGRFHFSSRAVVVSKFNPHDFRTVDFPWAVAMEQFYMQIANKLIRRGMSPREVYRFTKDHATRYNSVIDEIFKELIDESPFLGLPIILQRNPTIRRPSAILVYVTRIKTNTSDHTISVSVGNLVGMNCDFDGDELNNVHLQDVVSHDRFIVLGPEYNVMDLSTPWAINDTLKMPAPIVSTIANWINHGRRKTYGSV